MKKPGLLKVATSLLILILALSLAMETANAALTIKNVKTWVSTVGTSVFAVAKGDVDGDGKIEIVTGGVYSTGGGWHAQLCVWDGSTLALKNVRNWYWVGITYITSVAVGDVDGDGKNEIVTGGYYYNGPLIIAQLCVWDGATLALKNVQTWNWNSPTYIWSVAIGDVNGDGKNEIVTGDQYNDATRFIAQLCVWDGTTLALKNVKTWYWNSDTYIKSVAIADVDGDGKNEIITGGYYDSPLITAQLCVWDGTTLGIKNVKTWIWGTATSIASVAVGDVNGDGKKEIVTGGLYDDATPLTIAQLCVWDGATLALKNVQTWYWTSHTHIESVALGDVDADGKVEIVTASDFYNDATHYVAQLCAWDGATLALKNVQTWYWNSDTIVRSVVVGDVDGDGKTEIVTGGQYWNGTSNIAQLCVWA